MLGSGAAQWPGGAAVTLLSTRNQSVVSLWAAVAMCPCHTFIISNNAACLVTRSASRQRTHLSRQHNQLPGQCLTCTLETQHTQGRGSILLPLLPPHPWADGVQMYNCTLLTSSPGLKLKDLDLKFVTLLPVKTE